MAEQPTRNVPWSIGDAGRRLGQWVPSFGTAGAPRALPLLGAAAMVSVLVAACVGLPRSVALRGAATQATTAGQAAVRQLAPGQSAGESAGRALNAAPADASNAAGTAAKAAPQANAQGAPAAAGSSAGVAAAQSAPAGGVSGQALPPLPPSGRMVVKNGALTVQVTDLADAVQRVNAAISGVTGAYVAASSTTYRVADDAGVAAAQAQGRTLPPGPPISPIPPRPSPVPGQTASMTLKVPVDSFSDLLQRLRDIGKPLQENVSTQEVTDEYVDLDAQVRNLEATEQQYQALLQRAQKIEEILPIQQRLNDVRTQIDRLRGRMNLLQRQSDLSTITLTLVLPAKSGSETTVSGEPRVVQTLRDALARLGTILQVALDALIYVAVYALPVVPFALVYWWWRRGRHPGAVSSAAPTGAAM